MGGVVSDVFGGAADIVGDIGGAVGDVVGGAVDWATEHPLEAALLAAGVYYAPEIGAFIDGSGAVVGAGAEEAALNTGVTLGGATDMGGAQGLNLTNTGTNLAEMGGGQGLTSSTAANLAEMGGGQGLTTELAGAGGGVLGAAGLDSGALTAGGLATAAGVGTSGLDTLVTDPNGVLVGGGTGGVNTGGGTTVGGGGGGGGGTSSGNTDWTALLGGLAGLYNSKEIAAQQKAQFDKINATLESMYSPGSAEYQALWNQMSRADATAGRVSQLGPRSVDLAGKVAGIKSNALVSSLGNQNQMLNSSLMNQAGGLNDILKALGTSGASNSINSAISSGVNTGIKTLSDYFTS